jgi:hypothetical protein
MRPKTEESPAAGLSSQHRWSLQPLTKDGVMDLDLVIEIVDTIELLPTCHNY